MAAAVQSSPLPPSVAAAPPHPAFSALTLFESTLLNAGMLLDSMPLEDLMSAMRLVQNLQLQLVDVMQPSACELRRQLAAANRHLQMRATAAAAAASSASSVPAATGDADTDSPPPVKAKRPCWKAEAAEPPPVPPASAPVAGAGGRRRPSASAVAFVKADADAANNDDEGGFVDYGEGGDGVGNGDGGGGGDDDDGDYEDEDDDCVMLLDDDEASGEFGLLASSQSLSVSASSAAALVAAGHRQHRRRGRSLAASAAGTAGGSDCDERLAATAGAVGADVRNLLKETYKNLRGSGPHLFDFSKPWEHPVNQNVALSVIGHAQSASGLVADPNTWKIWVSNLYYSTKKLLASWVNNSRKYKRRNWKLSRRQKAFEALLPGLSPDDLEQYRLVLTRDFTSSDEEDDDDQAVLRVRQLAWESDRVRQIKAALDEAFLGAYATVKQRAQLGKCVRDSGARSARVVPAGAPSWAVQPAYTATAATGD